MLFSSLLTLAPGCHFSSAHTHGENEIEKSYTYDPFFIDVLSNHMKEENDFFDIGLSKSKNKKLINLIKAEKSYNQKSLTRMQGWRDSMYKEVEHVVAEKYDVTELKKAEGSEFEKKLSEKLKALSKKGKEISMNGEEQNFETPIKAFSVEAVKRYKQRLSTF